MLRLEQGPQCPLENRVTSQDDRHLRRSVDDVIPWEIVHACNLVRDIAHVIEAQVMVGMRPFLVTAAVGGVSAPSLMGMWNEVRHWRKQLEESGANFSAQLLHAHSFAPGMAGVRLDAALVYDVRRFIENTRENTEASNSWMGRSFRTAEQFVLSRASAVVVHAESMRKICVDRGIADQDVFTVPDPLGSDPVASADSARTLRMRLSLPENTIIVFSDAGTGHAEDASTLSVLLKAIKELRRDFSQIHLLVLRHEDEQRAAEDNSLIAASGVSEVVHPISHDEKNIALAIADIAIAANSSEADLAMQAMVQGCAVLAADSPDHRDLSPDGQGVLWFSAAPEDIAGDLLHRLDFLLRNPDFRRSLGNAAKAYLQDSRSMQKIGRLYDEVYRHATAKRRRGDSSKGNSGSLIPIHASF